MRHSTISGPRFVRGNDGSIVSSLVTHAETGAGGEHACGNVHGKKFLE
jgi:hypothetical protein